MDTDRLTSVMQHCMHAKNADAFQIHKHLITTPLLSKEAKKKKKLILTGKIYLLNRIIQFPIYPTNSNNSIIHQQQQNIFLHRSLLLGLKGEGRMVQGTMLLMLLRGAAMGQYIFTRFK